MRALCSGKETSVSREIYTLQKNEKLRFEKLISRRRLYILQSIVTVTAKPFGFNGPANTARLYFASKKKTSKRNKTGGGSGIKNKGGSKLIAFIAAPLVCPSRKTKKKKKGILCIPFSDLSERITNTRVRFHAYHPGTDRETYRVIRAVFRYDDAKIKRSGSGF